MIQIIVITGCMLNQLSNHISYIVLLLILSFYHVFSQKRIIHLIMLFLKIKC